MPTTSDIAKSYEKKHLQNLKKIEAYIKKVFNVTAAAAAKIAAQVVKLSSFSEDKPFTFDNYPQVKNSVNQMFNQFFDKIFSGVVNGITAAVKLANSKGKAIKQRYKAISQAAIDSRRKDAQNAFIERKEKGLNLSERVWNLTQSYKEEIEDALADGISVGESAESLQRKLKDKLNHPNKIFRRVRGKDGKLKLSQPAKAFHPGQGVYRSSRQNALRLAMTETNIAYRTTDYENTQQFDFVVGIKVVLSNNHTLNGEEFHDICDRLAGEYPKTFKFTGWHPRCRCHTETILMTLDEFAENEKRRENGQSLIKSKKEVTDVPDEFKNWVKENAERLKNAKSLPYFVRDNKEYFEGIDFPERLENQFVEK